MSRPRFLADNDLKDRIILGVRRREPAIEFPRLRELGLDRQPDDEVLAYAAREQFIVVSHDVNTMTAAAIARVASQQPMNGLLLAKQRGLSAPAIESLILIWAASEAEEWVGQIRYLPL